MQIRVYDGRSYTDVEVSDDFARQYKAMEHEEALIERKETRRHQSLNKSMENGFDVADLKVDIVAQIEQNELRKTLKDMLHKLTDKQRTVLILYAIEEFSFREIGEKMGISKDTVKEHFHTAVKKMKKFLKDTPSK